MHVLIIGYGKIGRIKAFVWKSLGLDVYVHDINSERQKLIAADGFNNYQDVRTTLNTIVDISTPAGKHVTALEWCLAQSYINAQTILIEKPLVSSRQELNLLQEVFKKHPDLQDRIYLNETYFQSSALQYIIKNMNVKDEEIKEINIELSKNRLGDNDAGRFFDFYLDAIGIEVPHMMAILEMLKVGSDVIKSLSSTLFIDEFRKDNQAVLLRSGSAKPAIKMTSYLGNFHEYEMISKNDASITRRLSIQTDKNDYLVEFDPAPNCPRFHSKVTTFSKGVQTSQIAIADDHLANHLRLFTSNEYLKHSVYIGLSKALENSETLIRLREMSKIVDIRTSAEHDWSQINNKENVDVVRD